MGQWKDESGSERRPCETVMDVKEPRRATHNAGRVDCGEYAGFERQPAAQPEAVCTTQTHCCVPGRPSWNASLPSVPVIESKLIPFKGLAICEIRKEAREKRDSPHKPIREHAEIRIARDLEMKRAGRAECWEHRERSRGKRGTYDSAMPLSFPAIEQLRYLWGGPPGLRPTPRRPVAGVKELDPSSGERVQGDPPRPSPDQGSAPRILAAVRTSMCATSSVGADRRGRGHIDGEGLAQVAIERDHHRHLLARNRGGQRELDQQIARAVLRLLNRECRNTHAAFGKLNTAGDGHHGRIHAAHA